MKSIAAVSRVKVSADGHGVVSHAGMGVLRELADLTGLSAQVSDLLADTYKGPWVYAPGAVFADLAAAVADGADCIDGVGQLCEDREHIFGAKASTTTMWRLVDQRIDAAHLPGYVLPGLQPGQRRGLPEPLPSPVSACVSTSTPHWLSTIPTTSRTRGRRGRNPSDITRCWRFWIARRLAGVRRWPGCCGPGNAGSNTAVDHIMVLEQALASLPPDWRPGSHRGAHRVVVRSDSAGSTHAFARACGDHGAGFSFGYPVDARVQDAVDTLNLGDA